MREALNAQKPQLTADDEMVVNQVYGNAHKLPSGLRYIVRNPGQGEAKPQIGDEVICHYAGRLLDGTEFDSSYRRGVPFTFRLGTGAVIRGWDEAFATMRKGASVAAASVDGVGIAAGAPVCVAGPGGAVGVGDEAGARAGDGDPADSGVGSGTG